MKNPEKSGKIGKEHLFSQPELMTVFAEPFLRRTVVRKNLFDDGIKSGGVVPLFAVSQFVYDDIIEHCRGCEDQPPVKI